MIFLDPFFCLCFISLVFSDFPNTKQHLTWCSASIQYTVNTGLRVELENHNERGGKGLESPPGPWDLTGHTVFICFMGTGVKSDTLERAFTSIRNIHPFVLRDKGEHFWKRGQTEGSNGLYVQTLTQTDGQLKNTGSSEMENEEKQDLVEKHL